jgi:hypothetical protein
MIRGYGVLECLIKGNTFDMVLLLAVSIALLTVCSSIAIIFIKIDFSL